MKSYRIFVEKYPEFRVEAESLLRDLNANLNLSLDLKIQKSQLIRNILCMN